MDRGKKQTWLKTMIKLRKELDVLPMGPRDLKPYAGIDRSGLTWERLEEPKFIGWESTILIGELSLRRPDAGLLIQAAKLVGQSEPTFFTNLNTLRLIRKGKTYGQIIALHREEVRRKKLMIHEWQRNLPEGVGSRRGRKFTIEQFKKQVPEHLHPYFELKETLIAASAWRDSYYHQEYRLGGKFPLRDLRVKVDKVFATHRGIPKSDEISRHQEIDEIFTQQCVYNKLYGKNYRCSKWFYNYEYRARRKYLKGALKVSKNHHWYRTPFNYDDPYDDYYDIESNFDKLYAKKRRGKY